MRIISTISALSLMMGTLLIGMATPAAALPEGPQHGLALHGNTKYHADFQHFDHANPNAPKGGELRLASLGTYDTINPFTLKGVAADGAGLVFETLMAAALDEPFSQYGWIAETVAVAQDRSWVSYKLRPQARFHDGSSVTPDDVIFSYEILRDKGHPQYRSYYKDVAKAEKTGPREVRFILKDKTNAELPMILGQLPVFSKAFWQGKDFSATTLQPIMGSGPYEFDAIEQGRSLSFKRVKDWWAKDLPINKGRYNFDTIVYDYYRDETVALEALFAGRYDLRMENVAKNWALAYTTPAVRQGQIQKLVIKNELPSGMQGFVMNTRRDLFKDRRVREALNYAFDFEWGNKNVAYGAYERTRSYFDNSELASKGLPSKEELKLLEPWRGKVPDEVFTHEYAPPVTDGSGDNRENLHKAADLLKQAGWTLSKEGKLVNAQGKPFVFEILDNKPIFERWAQPFIRNLERLGIQANLRIVDSSQYQNRLDNFDYDMIIYVFGQSLSPGNEQYDFWSSTKANTKGSRNRIGVRDPAVDDIVNRLIRSQSREELVTACHALDRLLLWQHYVIPHWHFGAYRVAAWDIFGRPNTPPPYGLDIIGDWWIDSSKAEKINALRKRNR
ncbi:MAG: extracellular solute-binding protein [Bdellovibrionales bacterium]